jgi:hypothetical protein
MERKEKNWIVGFVGTGLGISASLFMDDWLPWAGIVFE